MPRCRATGCSSGPATSAASAPASTPGCRSACGCCAGSRRIVREEMDAIGAQELLFPALLPEGAVRGERSLDRVRRQHLPPQGPQGRRLPPRPDPRGDVHPRGQGPLLVLQGPAAVDLPDPDQVPRRGPSAGRPAARARVRHEGLLLVRHRRGRARQDLPAAPRRLHPDLRPPRLPLRDRPGDGRGDGRQQERGVPRHRRERRGHLRPLRELRVCRERRGRARARSRPGRLRRRPGRPRRGHSRHPHHRDAGRPPQRSTSRGTTDPGRPATPSRTSSSCSRTPTARASPWPSACPETARSTRSAWAPRSSRPRWRPSTRRTSRRTPRWSRATSAPVPWAQQAACEGPLPPRPPRRRGHPLGDRCRRARQARHRPRGRPRLHRRRHDRGRRGARRRRVPELRARPGVRPRHRDGPHLPARHEVRRGARPQGARPERQARQTVTWAPTASASRAPWPAVAEGNHDELGLRWPREISPADVHVVATGKDDATRGLRQGRGDRPRPRGAGPDGPLRRPPEGQPGREVQGLRADRRPDHRRRRASLAERHRRGQGPRARASAARSRSTASWPRSSARSAAPRGPAASSQSHQPVDAVIFDWGGTLTPWHDVDLPQQWRVFAREVHGLPVDTRGCPPRTSPRPTRWPSASTRPRSAPGPEGGRPTRAPRSRRSSRRPGSTPPTTGTTWRSRHTGGSGSRTPTPTRRCARCGRGCTTAGSRSGCCPTPSGAAPTTARCSSATASSTSLDGDVYSSEIHVVKPHPRRSSRRAPRSASSRRRRSTSATGCSRTCTARSRSACARSGSRTATSRLDQQVAVDVTPDAQAHELLDILDIVDGWLGVGR